MAYKLVRSYTEGECAFFGEALQALTRARSILGALCVAFLDEARTADLGAALAHVMPPPSPVCANQEQQLAAEQEALERARAAAMSPSL
jgi:hypothetical protein